MLECKICHMTLSDEDVSKYNNICPFCHTKNSFYEEYIMDIKRISPDESFVDAMIKLKNENPIEYQLKMKEFELQKEQEKQFQKIGEESNKPHCPTCGSTNIRQIPGTERAISIIGLGIFSEKINKTYKCLNCKCTW